MRSLFPSMADIGSALESDDGSGYSQLSKRNSGGMAGVKLYGPELFKKERAEQTNVLVRPNDPKAPFENIGYNIYTGSEYETGTHESTGVGFGDVDTGDEYYEDDENVESPFGQADYDESDEDEDASEDGEAEGFSDYEASEGSDSDEYAVSNPFEMGSSGWDLQAEEYNEEVAVDPETGGFERGPDVSGQLGGFDLSGMNSDEVYSFEDHRENHKKEENPKASNAKKTLQGASTASSEQRKRKPMSKAQSFPSADLRDGREMGVKFPKSPFPPEDNGVYVDETAQEQIDESGTPVSQIEAHQATPAQYFEELPQFGRSFMSNKFAQSMTQFLDIDDRVEPDEVMPQGFVRQNQIQNFYSGSGKPASSHPPPSRAIVPPYEGLVTPVRPVVSMQAMVADKNIAAANRAVPARAEQQDIPTFTEAQMKEAIKLAVTQALQSQKAGQLSGFGALGAKIVDNSAIVELVDTRMAQHRLACIQKCLSHMKGLLVDKQAQTRLANSGAPGASIVYHLQNTLNNAAWMQNVDACLDRTVKNLAFIDSKNRARIEGIQQDRKNVTISKDILAKFAEICVTIELDLESLENLVLRPFEKACDLYCTDCIRKKCHCVIQPLTFVGIPKASDMPLILPNQPQVNSAMVSQAARDLCAKKDCISCVKIAFVNCNNCKFDASGRFISHADLRESRELNLSQKNRQESFVATEDQELKAVNPKDIQNFVQTAGLDYAKIIKQRHAAYIIDLVKFLVLDVSRGILTSQEAVKILRGHFGKKVQADGYGLNPIHQSIWADMYLTKDEYKGLRNSEIAKG